MRLVITIIALVAYFLFKGVGSAIGRNANVPHSPVDLDTFESDEQELEAEARDPQLEEPMLSPESESPADVMAAKPSVAVTPAPAVKSENKEFVIDDPKKLILYSEIMKPKFDE